MATFSDDFIKTGLIFWGRGKIITKNESKLWVIFICLPL